MCAMDAILPQLSKIRLPLPGEKIYKDECVLSFDTPESENGLYVCMSTFLGFGRRYVELHYKRTGNSVFLHIQKIKKEISPTKNNSEKKKPIRMALGVEGGFHASEGKKVEYEEVYTLIILPDFVHIQLPNSALPESVQFAIKTVIAADSASKVEEANTWDGETKQISKHSNTLPQLDNGVKVPPRGWKCQRCDMTENLWLNLTDGAINCGRKVLIGSGGNNHAVDHFRETNFPLVVKLGTITPNSADVYSYDEDNMVEDSNLSVHLSHFGINVSQMEKTAKSTVELEIDMNQSYNESTIIQEDGFRLIPIYGSGYTGLANLGNSCYLSSVMQVIFAIPDFRKRYYEGARRIFENLPLNPTQDFNVQMAKLGCGLISGEYSKPPSNNSQAGEEVDVQSQPGIRPRMFKNLIGKGHPEFSTKKQQDAQEFFLHLINVLERNNRGLENPAECFKFQIEERIQCVQSGKVRYTPRTDYLLSLMVPLEAADNKEAYREYERKKEAQEYKFDPSEVVRPRVPLLACLENFAAEEIIGDFFSTALNAKSSARKTTRLKSFPDYLMVQLKKYAIGNYWAVEKLDVSVTVPDCLDLLFLRGHGLQPGEEELPNPEPNAAQESEFEYDTAVLSQLSEMGFNTEDCKRSLYHTQNSGVEAAMNWIMERMNDPDFGTPFVLPGVNRQNNPTTFSPSLEALDVIMSMGFTTEQATQALKSTDNNVERAVDWIFNHRDELESSPMDQQSSVHEGFRDGSEKYKLVAFISHMGPSTMAGHYVCHILQEGRWVIYNDSKVALSEHPPKDLGYLYLYQRM